ncbi:putative disease resistance protein At4g19050 [Vigna angularis]|uniref:putative disease resistance protein At4g19050 n=1 Tax=Phaseolus angularis TaxID=3914 RepID=UPI0022B50F4D|nr:putative disease resistance protein At4g19050 [Vigna angularis]
MPSSVRLPTLALRRPANGTAWLGGRRRTPAALDGAKTATSTGGAYPARAVVAGSKKRRKEGFIRNSQIAAAFSNQNVGRSNADTCAVSKCYQIWLFEYHFPFQFLTSSPRAKAWLKKQLILLDLYETRVGKVKDVVEKLKSKRDAIQHTVDEEERRHGRRIHDEVKEWMESVDKLIRAYEDFHNDEICHKCAVFDFFNSGYLPKPGIRYRRSRKANDITKQANGLLQNAKFDILSYWSGPPSMATFFSNLGYESYSSRKETVKKITAEFQKPDVRTIGLHGLSGVGKTSLVKEVVKKALKDKMFEVVTMASVTKSPDVRKIQGQIADMLGIVLEEESDIARAARIHQILNNENNSTLIILDDLWEQVNFNLLGIPCELEKEDGLTKVQGKPLDVDSLKNVVSDGKSLGTADWVNVKRGGFLGGSSKNVSEGKSPLDASERVKAEHSVPQYKGCKILMISEIKQVLLKQMEGKEESIFPVEVLKEKEAEMLFKKKAGISGKNSEYDKLAAQIASKCKGLPMTIVTTARALKNKSLSVWDETNRKLESQNLTGAPEFSTKLSYELLVDEELKDTFLLCARMGHDALIMDLVKYCIGFGFLRGVNTARQTRDRVYTLVGKLKESGLLSDSYSSDHFTMPDTVRRAALSIEHEENQLFTMTKGKLDEWPDKLERYTAISLHHCDFIEDFSGRIEYPRLRVLQIVNNIPRPNIPKNFFKGVKELRVLILTGIHLSLIDSSISSLHKLRMLCLEQCCILDEELSILGELKRLRVLSFSGSDIKSLPDELNELKMLQIFDISNCSKLKKIPRGVMSSLVSLEELYMRNTLIQWEDEEQTCQSKTALLSDLKHLNQLTTLDIQIPNVLYLPKNLFFDKLDSYKIAIGDLSSFLETGFQMPEIYETLKFLAVQLVNGSDIHSLLGIKMLFEGVENLFLELNTVHEKHSVREARNIVHDLFYRLNLKGFPCLRYLWIVNNSTIQSLIHPKDRQHHEKAFPKLESLHLYNLKMDEICSCKLSEPSFGKLKVIKINLCRELKNVFSISMVGLLKVLETIEVSECSSLKEIINVGPPINLENTELLMLPELRYLKLQSLSEFIGFDAIPSIHEGERKLFHEKVGVSKLERLELSSIQIDVIWSVNQSSERLSFENLTHLDVNGCWNLKSLMSFTMAKSLVNLRSLYVSECGKMTSIFLSEQDTEKDIMGSIFPKLKNMKLCSIISLSKIWYPKLPSDSCNKLETLIIEECHRLENALEGIFGSLCNLRVRNCRSMQAIFNIGEQVGDVANNLQDVHLETLPKLELVWKSNDEDLVGIPKFNNLKKIWAQVCDNLEYIFPFYVAKNLDNLESLVVCDCRGLSKIVAEKHVTNTDTAKFIFPKLSTIKFSHLPKLTSFYPTSYDLSCPLNELSIEFCNNLEPFNNGTEHAQTNPVHALFPEEVINNLKSMQIEFWHAKSPNSYMGKGNHRRDNLEELSLSRLTNTEILYSFLYRNPNLKSLSLNYCFFEKIVPPKEDTEIENLGVVPNLKSLMLIDLFNLKELSFEPDIILERLEFLILKNCCLMITIAPSSVSFTRLTNLEVVNCDRLQSLMTASTAKSLVQLNTMKVVKCESLMEIVRKDGEQSDRIVFQQLKALELVSLKNLKSLCVSDCDFEFPSLEKLVVSACYNMDKFSNRVTISPILQNVHVVHGKENKRCCWEGDINATVQKIFKEKKFFEGMEEISLSEHQELQETWQPGADLQKKNSWFYSLKILKLENCVIQPCAIPSNILPYLRSLKELQVQGCNNIEVIFEMNAEEGTGSTFHLQKLTLQKLPKLKDVWERNGKGTENFQNLKLVNVKNCENLQTVFPLTLAKSLKKVDELEIVDCRELYEIVRKEDDTAAVFVFPCLTTLALGELPKLTYFYPESFTLECSALHEMNVWNCPELKLFESTNRQSIFFHLKVINMQYVLG